jgi:hypothetical protein
MVNVFYNYTGASGSCFNVTTSGPSTLADPGGWDYQSCTNMVWTLCCHCHIVKAGGGGGPAPPPGRPARARMHGRPPLGRPPCAPPPPPPTHSEASVLHCAGWITRAQSTQHTAHTYIPTRAQSAAVQRGARAWIPTKRAPGGRCPQPHPLHEPGFLASCARAGCFRQIMPIGQYGPPGDFFPVSPWDLAADVAACTSTYSVVPQPNWIRVAFGGKSMQVRGRSLCAWSGRECQVKGGGVDWRHWRAGQV